MTCKEFLEHVINDKIHDSSQLKLVCQQVLKEIENLYRANTKLKRENTKLKRENKRLNQNIDNLFEEIEYHHRGIE